MSSPANEPTAPGSSPSPSPRTRAVRPFAIIALLAAGVAAWLVWPTRHGGELVIYCAHDSEFAEPLIKLFERKTGIRCIVKFDTEATKSLGLAQQIQNEAAAPQCDVFWNNQAMNTLLLKDAGLLEPYSSPNLTRFPRIWRDTEGHWAAFGGRLRMTILEGALATSFGTPGNVGPTQDDYLRNDLGMIATHSPLGSPWATLAIAKPLYGTTATHFAALWALHGEEEVKDWYSRLRKSKVGVTFLNGNAAVKNAVVEKGAMFGFTDSDDFFSARDSGKPLAGGPIRVGLEQRTICVPNTVAIIRGTKHAEAARKFVDFLLSEEAEVALANSPSRQIPLGSISPGTRLPKDVQTMRTWAADSVTIAEIAPTYARCLDWLKSEFVK